MSLSSDEEIVLPSSAAGEQRLVVLRIQRVKVEVASGEVVKLPPPRLYRDGCLDFGPVVQQAWQNESSEELKHLKFLMPYLKALANKDGNFAKLLTIAETETELFDAIDKRFPICDKNWFEQEFCSLSIDPSNESHTDDMPCNTSDTKPRNESHTDNMPCNTSDTKPRNDNHTEKRVTHNELSRRKRRHLHCELSAIALQEFEDEVYAEMNRPFSENQLISDVEINVGRKVFANRSISAPVPDLRENIQTFVEGAYGTENCCLYQFSKTYPQRSSVNHYQLCQMLHCISPSEICFFHWTSNHFYLRKFDTFSESSVDFDIPSAEGRFVSCCHANSKFAAYGTFSSRVNVVHIPSGKKVFARNISRHDDIVNCIRLQTSNPFGMDCGDTHMLTGCNDSRLTRWCLETSKRVWSARLPWSVNHIACSPDNKLYCVSGDSMDVYLLSSEDRQLVTCLKGHREHGFCASWHPNGHLLATGNQDHTCKIWDIRFPRASLLAIDAPIRSVSFSPDGRRLLFCESYQYSSIYDVDSNFKQCQAISVGLSNITGSAFSPDGSKIWIGCENNPPGILELVRCDPVPCAIAENEIDVKKWSQTDVTEQRHFNTVWLHNLRQ